MSDARNSAPAVRQLNVEVPEDLHRWLRVKAAQEGRSMASFVRELLAAIRRSDDA